MEIRQLRAFVAVAEAESFTRAAERLTLGQSAVSASIRGLEAECDVSLFDRTTRRVALSDAGQALLPEARAVLAAAALAADAVAQAKGGLRGTVALGIMEGWARPSGSVAELIAEFRRDYPLVEVTVRRVGGSLALAEHVRNGGLDLAYLSLPQAVAPGLSLAPLGAEPIRLACQVDHPLAHRRSVTLSELADESWVDTPRDWGLRLAVDRAFELAGLSRTLRYEVNDNPTVIEFVHTGVAVALLTESMTARTPKIRLIPISDPHLIFRTFLAEPSGRRPTAAAQALATAARQQAAETPDAGARSQPGRSGRCDGSKGTG